MVIREKGTGPDVVIGSYSNTQKTAHTQRKRVGNAIKHSNKQQP